MSNVAKLKKQAAEFELKRQFDKALAIYIKLLDSFDENVGELDVALFNRVGDLLLRQGNVADAVDYYERAVDRYADTGFFNNAIALCNKILRHSPGRASVYYKLGKISAQKGFKNDAKVNFLEYADRMQKAGKVDESFRALKEFADLCPDQDEIRLMLADQLTKAGRQPEAIEQLQILHQRYDADGRAAEAAATAARMRSIDPAVEPRSAMGSGRQARAGELIFLDLDTPSPRSSGAYQRVSTPPPITPVAGMTPPESLRPPTTPISDLPLIDDGAPRSPVERIDTPLPGVTRVGDDAIGLEQSTPTSSLAGLEATSLTDETPPSAQTPPSAPLLDFEPTSLDVSALEDIPPVDRSATPTHGMRSHGATPNSELEFILPPPAEQMPPRTTPSIEFDLSNLTTPSEPIAPRPPRPTPAVRTPLDGLPLMDLEMPADAPPTPRPLTPRDAATFSDAMELIDAADATAEPPVETPIVDAPIASGASESNTERIVLDDGEPILVSTPSASRKATLVAARSVELLRDTLRDQPENWGLHRELAEAMLEAGDREGGIHELELAMTGAERAHDLELASAIAEEVARLEPESVKHHQKRVEYAFRTNDRARLIEAYVALADSLLRGEQTDKARSVYQRVLDLAPDDVRARAALDVISAPAPEAPPETRAAVDSRAAAAPASPPSATAGGESFVNLGDWLRDSAAPKDTRMVVDEQEPSGDEQADFADMLRKFKQGVAENVDAEDYQSHYDLAIAFKEMGLLDEAIAEFQKALGSPTNRLPTYEALGDCFLEKGNPKLASSILSRALNEKASEEQLLGVYYLLGRAAEMVGNAADALGYYQRVFVLDIQFRDIADRLSDLERAAR